MNEFQRLIAYLKILYHNLTTLHRNLVKDDAWFANHKQIGKWYEEVSDQIDDLVETGIALGYLEPGIKESVLEFSNDCLAVQPRGPEESFRLILGYFRSVAGMMQAADSDEFSFHAFSLDATVFEHRGEWYYICSQQAPRI